MWTVGIRVFGRCAIYLVCEIIQPCTTQCIAQTIGKAKISCKTSMFKPSAQDFLTPFGTLQRYTAGLGGSVGCAVRLETRRSRFNQGSGNFEIWIGPAQLDALSDWRPGGRGFNPRRGRQHSFVEIDHEMFSTVILSLPLIQEGQLSVSDERMCTILVNCLED